MLNGTLTWNGITSSDLGIKVERFPALNRPARKYDRYSVPGRNGDLFIWQDAWNNYDQEYEIYAAGTPANWRDIMAWLMPETEELNRDRLTSLEYGGYRHLVDSYEPDTIRLAAFLYDTAIENSWNLFGRATIRFACRPERFTDDAFDIHSYLIGDSEVLYNPTDRAAKPWIELNNVLLDPFTSGTLATINGRRIVYNSAADISFACVDCERMDISQNGVGNLSSHFAMPDGFPILQPGANSIIVDDVEQLDIVPRWWRL